MFVIMQNDILIPQNSQ